MADGLSDPAAEKSVERLKTIPKNEPERWRNGGGSGFLCWRNVKGSLLKISSRSRTGDFSFQVHLQKEKAARELRRDRAEKM